jgi:hypothetical protein
MATAASTERITRHVARLLRTEGERSPFASVRTKAVAAATRAGLTLPEQDKPRPPAAPERTA